MDKIIHIKTELECNVQHAFKMFTENKMLESWLTNEAEVIPELGGKYELFWIPENKNINSTIGCKITGIEQDSYISFEWKGPVDFETYMNVADPLTHVIVTFSWDPKRNMTNIHLFHTGWRNNNEWDKAREYFENAWSNALKELKDKIQKKQL